MTDFRVSKILVLIGARYLGHAHPISSFLSALTGRLPEPPEVILRAIPLSTGASLPSFEFLRRQSTDALTIDQLALPLIRQGPIKDYCDLLEAQQLTRTIRIVRLIDLLSELIDRHAPDLILTDSLPGVPQLGRAAGVNVVAIRSHALIQRFDCSIWRDVFLDTPILQEHVQRHHDVLDHFEEILDLEIAISPTVRSVDALYYHCPTITPGFACFDFKPAVATHHAFMRLGHLPDNASSDLKKEALIYVRNSKLHEQLRRSLEFAGYAPIFVDEQRPTEFDFWHTTVNASLLVSHGGHGMCISGLYQALPHIVIADNDDRFTNGSRIEKVNCGLCIDWRQEGSVNPSEFDLALRAVTPTQLSRTLLNQSSLTPTDVAREFIDHLERQRISHENH